MCLFVLEQGNRYIHYTLYLSLVFTTRTGKTHFENTHIIVFKTKLKRNVKKIRVFSVLTYGQSLWTIVRFLNHGTYYVFSFTAVNTNSTYARYHQ